MKIHALTTVESFKDYAQISEDATYDKQIKQMIQTASASAERYTNRKLRARKYGTGGLGSEYLSGFSENRVFLKNYPVISVESLFVDQLHVFAADTEIEADDYSVLKEQGILSLLSSSTTRTIFPEGTANIKINYTAGYDSFIVFEGENDKIDIKEGTGTAAEVVIDYGVYQSKDLATEIETQLNASTGLALVYTVQYNPLTGKFLIKSSSDFTILWSTGDNSFENIGELIGFNTDGDSSASASLTSDFGVLGIPEELEFAVLLITLRMWNRSGIGSDQFDVSSKTVSTSNNDITTKYAGGYIPEEAMAILNRYKKEC